MTNYLAKVIHFFIKFLHLTYRYSYEDEANRQKAVLSTNHNSFVLATWHENILLAVATQANFKRYVCMVSKSKDGDFASQVLYKFGFDAVRGSSSKDGQKALMSMINLVKQGQPGAITVDGPRGPRREVKKGIIEISRATGVPILPFIAAPEKYWQLKSWDQFRIPKPFTKIIIKYGDPITVPSTAKPENYKEISERIKEKLNTGETIAYQNLGKSKND